MTASEEQTSEPRPEDRETDAEERLDDDPGGRYLRALVTEILTHEDPERFHAYLREAVDTHRDFFGTDASLEARRAMALATGRGIWNVTPLPSHGMRPRPLPAVQRNDPCPCGSGKKHKKCCGGFATLTNAFDADPDAVEMLAYDLLDPSQRDKIRGLDNGGADRQCTILAATEIEEGRPERAMELLEPVLERGLASDHPLYLMAFETALHALAALDREDEIQGLAARAAAARRASPMRAAGRVQVAERTMLDGEPERALELLRLAERDDPDVRFLPYVEVQAIEALGKHDEALARAEQWIEDLLADEEIDRRDEVDALENWIENGRRGADSE